MAAHRRFVDELVNAINEYREQHQVKPLRLNSHISSISQKWADHMATTGLFQHNPDSDFDGQPLGENCAMKWSSRAAATDYSGREVADKWYVEIRDYDFERHRGANTGHFTQLVWKSSREIGVGRAQSRDGKWFVVANFFPAGNYAGCYDDNVLPVHQQTTQRQTQTRNGSPSTKPVNINRRVAAQASPFRPISSSPSLSDASEDERYSSKRATWKQRSQPQQLNQQKQQHQQQQPEQHLRHLNQQTKLKSTDAGLDVGFVVLERNTETKVQNGVKVKKVTETRRGRDGQLSIVVMETMDQQVSDVIRRRVPIVEATMPRANNELSRVTRADGKPNTARPADEEFADQVLHQHNVYRSRHGNVNSLTLNEELSKMATKWAQYLVSINSLLHSNTKYKGVDLGENITMKNTDRGKTAHSGKEAVKLWYDEIQLYDFDKPESCAERCGHYTQVVWKGSREIGVGRAFADGGHRVCVVCYYFPPGNFIGKFGANVLRPSR